MLKLNITALLFLTAGYLLGAVEPVLIVPDYADPGNAIQVSVHGVLLDDVSVSLFNGQGKAVSRASGFVWTGPDGSGVNVALLGIPSDLPQGRYTIALHARDGQAQWNLEDTITVRSSSYPENIIRLNETMNTLYTENSERKKKEARALWGVLTQFNSNEIHHTGAFLKPVIKGTVTSDFGERRLYQKLDGSENASIHAGQDLWEKPGTSILAAGKGRVVMAVERYLTGNTVILEHLPGVYTLYYHLDTIKASLGQIVEAGDEIGTLGATGFATGEHLHWELRTSTTAIQPSQYLDRPLIDIESLYP